MLYTGGIDAQTGQYAFPPTRVETLSKRIQRAPEDPQEAHQLERGRKERRLEEQGHLGPKEGVDMRDLAAAGWGVVFAPETDPAVREALRPLLEHRRRQASAVDERRFRDIHGDEGWRPGESKWDFLGRLGAGPGPADPDRVPYYLMLVGGPDAIPWRAQFQLDLEYAVGRLDLESPDDYAAYARAVVAAESTDARQPDPTALFFAPRNAGDEVTRLTADHLVSPMAEYFAAENGAWRVEKAIAEEATKARLAAAFAPGAVESVRLPSLLFAAAHGLAFGASDPRQQRHQGALVCQDWPGPGERQKLSAEHYFSADDLVAGATGLSGASGGPAGISGQGWPRMIAFLVACFGGGTPFYDSFPQRTSGAPRQMALAPFSAALPRRLLGRSEGGALAVVAHVDRAFNWSFLWPKAREPQLETYRSALRRLVNGYPIGSALEYFDRRYGELAASLADTLQHVGRGKKSADRELVRLWTAVNDAKSYVILGDPAVRLAGSRTPRGADR